MPAAIYGHDALRDHLNPATRWTGQHPEQRGSAVQCAGRSSRYSLSFRAWKQRRRCAYVRTDLSALARERHLLAQPHVLHRRRIAWYWHTEPTEYGRPL